MARNTIEMVVYYYADDCSPGRGLCNQWFSTPQQAQAFLREQGYTQISVNEYVRTGAGGRDTYRAVITDMRPPGGQRRDWRRVRIRADTH